MAKKARIVWDVNPDDLEKSLKLLKQIRKEAGLTDDQVEEIGESFEENQKQIDKNKSSLEDLKGTVAKLGIAGAVLAAGKAFADLTKEIQKARKETAQLTSLTGKELDIMVAKIRATANVFNKEYNEVLDLANTLSKEFDISMNEALENINQGFLRGIDINGEYLDSIREYSTFAKEAGISAKQFNIILQEQQNQGIFSDKGIDAIKEAVLSIREMTPVTKEAIEGIGLSADKITADIQSGAKTYFEVIQEIGRKTNEITDPTKLGAIYADVFKGAGEDAGKFVLNLSKIGDEYGELTKEQREFLQSQQNILIAQEKLNLKLVEFAADMGKAWRYITDLGLKAFNLLSFGATDFADEMMLVAKRVEATWGGQNSSSILNQIFFVTDAMKDLEEQGKKNTDDWAALHMELSILEGLLDKTSTKTLSDFVDNMDKLTDSTEKAKEEVKDLVLEWVKAFKIFDFEKDKYFDNLTGTYDDALDMASEYFDNLADIKAEKGTDIFRDDKDGANKDQEEIDAEKRKQEEIEEGRKGMALQSFEYISNLSNTLTSLKLANLQREFVAAEGNEKKQRQIMEKMAKVEKNQATFQAIINTAAGITKAFPVVPLMAFVAAMGALQIATIRAQPLPKYKKGGMVKGKSHEHGGVVIEAEGGEYIARKEAVKQYPELLKRVNSLQLDKSVVDSIMSGKSDGVTVVNSNKELIDALKDKPDWQVMVDEHGFTTRMRSKFGSYTQQRNRFRQ